VRLVFKLRVVNRKYAQAILTNLRNKSISQIEFRKGLVRLGRILGLEIAEDYDYEEVEVETPLGVVVRGVRMKDLDNTIIVTVLRAAWPLTEGLIKIFYNAKQGVIAARRVEERGMKNYDFEVEVSYVKLPKVTSENIVIISDVMVATGSTLLRVIDKVRERGEPKRFYVASVISTPIAIEKLQRYADVSGIDLRMFTLSIDPEVNDKGFIVPGLGDAGDRAFGS